MTKYLTWIVACFVLAPFAFATFNTAPIIA